MGATPLDVAAWLGGYRPSLPWLDNGPQANGSLRLALALGPGEAATLEPQGLGRPVIQGRLNRA